MVGWIVETTLMASGLAVVAALACRLRVVGPATRHVLWLVVLVRLVTPPVFSWPWAVDWRDQSPPFIFSTPTHAEPVIATDDPLATPSEEVADAIASFDLNQAVGLDQLPADLGVVPAVADREMDDSSEASSGDRVRSWRAISIAMRPDHIARLVAGLGQGWLLLTALLGIAQAWRIIRFRDRLQSAVPASDDLIEEAERIAGYLGVRVPELLVVSDLHTPMVWCLGRPKLLLPAHLVKTVGLDRWRAILIHELAHIRRGDHWTSRLELAAGLIWWWNPIYWLARSRLDAEAELACDAWVVSFLPKDRLAYAEALFDIFSTLSMVKAPAPALGAAGSGQLFERRLTMILHDQVSCRLSPVALLSACFLVLFALPSWSAATPLANTNEQTVMAALLSTVDRGSAITNDDDDDDDDDDEPAIAKAKADLKKAEEALKKIEAETRKAKAKKAKKDAKKAEADESDEKENPGFDFSQLAETIEKQIAGKFGPDFEKKMEELGERIEKEIESKFGPDFEKKMEELGEKLGKDMEAKLGEGSDFEKAMKKLGKELEATLGSGSDFEKKMKEMSKELEAKLGPGSDFEKKIKETAERMASELEKAAKKGAAPKDGSTTSPGEGTTKAPAPGNDRQRERRIATLEDQIKNLADELKALKAAKDQD